MQKIKCKEQIHIHVGTKSLCFVSIHNSVFRLRHAIKVGHPSLLFHIKLNMIYHHHYHHHHHHHSHLQPNGIGHPGWLSPREFSSLHLLLDHSTFLLRSGMIFYTNLVMRVSFIRNKSRIQLRLQSTILSVTSIIHNIVSYVYNPKYCQLRI
jgi:hypothetical protein